MATCSSACHAGHHKSLDRFGLDIAPELVELARRRLPELADRLWVGNALEWEPPHRFTYIRTGLEYVPRDRRRELVERLLGWCERLIIGVFNEQAHARPTEELLRQWGHRIAGRSERAHRSKPGMDYRVVWIDAACATGSWTRSSRGAGALAVPRAVAEPDPFRDLSAPIHLHWPNGCAASAGTKAPSASLRYRAMKPAGVGLKPHAAM